jgi:hypothetical protein
MEKNVIKIKLREALDELFSVTEVGHKDFERNPRRDDDEPKKNNLNKKQGEGGKKDYTDVKRSFEKIGGPSMVDVMKLTGIPDDEKGVNRSLFRKKVKQIKNKDTGSYYQFSDEELNQVRAALDIQK